MFPSFHHFPNWKQKNTWSSYNCCCCCCCYVFGQCMYIFQPILFLQNWNLHSKINCIRGLQSDVTSNAKWVHTTTQQQNSGSLRNLNQQQIFPPVLVRLTENTFEWYVQHRVVLCFFKIIKSISIVLMAIANSSYRFIFVSVGN